MANSTGQVSVSASVATQITDPALNQSRVVLRNQDATNYVAVGFSDAVTTSTGYRVLKGAELEVWLEEGDELWGLADSGAVVVEFIAQDSRGNRQP
jgi:hypothetical protein